MRKKILSKTCFIRKDVNTIVSYISEVDNLCSWTKFFKKLNRKEEGIGFFDTPFGEIQTKIFTESYKNTKLVIISSLIRGKTEEAVLFVSPENNNSKVIFQVPLPKEASDEFIKNQETILENELNNLVVLVEENDE